MRYTRVLPWRGQDIDFGQGHHTAEKKPILARNLWRGIGKQELGSEQGRKEHSKPAIGVNPGGRLFHARLLQGIVYKNLDSLL